MTGNGRERTTISAKIISLIVMAVLGLGYCAFWAAHLVGVLNRREFRPLDRVFWFGVLLIPFVGLILYRGLAPEFIKRKSSRKSLNRM